jgi:predicted ATPase/DNA-binding SARP family transcriptional activator
MVAPWRVRQFGAVAIEGPGFEPGGVSPFETQRSAKILTLLCLVRHGQMRREDLADALWPDDYYDATRLRLRKELSRLRQALGPAAAALVSEGESIGLDRAAIATDLEMLKRAANFAVDDSRRETALREARDIASGEFLPGWDDPWAVAERNAAEALKCRILVGLAEIQLAKGEAEAALSTVRPVIDRDPCHEEARLIAIQAHAALGSLAAAVGEFQQMKRLIRERHDRAPSDDAEELFVRMQRVTETPASRTVPAEPPQLPPLPEPLDRFFGRAEELTRLSQVLDPASPVRLLTLTGTGGIGKSRLALEFARTQREAFSGNVAFISLAESASPEAAADTLLAHLGWQGAAAADPIAVVASSLPQGPCLLVMDNLEHLLPQAAGLIKRLLEANVSLRVLVTSRQPLRIAGERVVALGPLGDAAAEMLADLGKAIRPGVENDPDLAELAKRLDGIPLALRLAATRLRVLGPAALLVRLGDRFRLLQGDAPDLPERHRSLRAALDGSFEALEAREQEILLRMSPFRGGWTLGHLERLSPEHDSLEAMETLVDASLVQVDDRGPSVRFGMLATVREYLIGRAGVASEGFVRTIARELKDRFPDLLSPRTLEMLRSLDAEADNLHAALESAIESDAPAAAEILSRLWFYDSIRGRHREFERLFREFCAAHPNAILSSTALFGIATILAGLERSEEAVALFGDAQRSFASQGDFLRAALAEAALAASQRRIFPGTLDEALKRYDALVLRAREEGGRGGESTLSRLLQYQGSHFFYAGRLAEAAAALDEAHQISLKLGDDVGTIASLQVRAYVSLDLGLPELARRECAAIEAKMIELGDPLRVSHHEEILGRIAMQLGDARSALDHFVSARNGWSRLGNRYQWADQENSIARALLGLGRWPEAVEPAHAAFVHWQACGDLGGVAVSLHTLTAIRLAADDDSSARKALSAAMALTGQHSLEFVRSENEFVDSLSLAVQAKPVDDLEALFR